MINFEYALISVNKYNKEDLMVIENIVSAIFLLHNMQENLFVRCNTEYYDKLMESIAQLKAGRFTKGELFDE